MADFTIDLDTIQQQGKQRSWAEGGSAREGKSRLLLTRHKDRGVDASSNAGRGLAGEGHPRAPICSLHRTGGIRRVQEAGSGCPAGRHRAAGKNQVAARPCPQARHASHKV